tara:strand:+ start:164 stop:1600 length:1437 start_codon:yes stop_codon:yes gene_type:complete
MGMYEEIMSAINQDERAKNQWRSPLENLAWQMPKMFAEGQQQQQLKRETFMANTMNSVVGDISNIYDNSTLQNKKNIVENRFGKDITSQSSEIQDMYNIKMAELDNQITKNANFNSRIDYIDSYDEGMEEFFTRIQDRDLTQEDVLEFKTLQKEFIDNNTDLFEGNPYRMAKNPHLTTRINSLKDMSIYAIRNMEDLRMNDKEKNAFLNAIKTDSLTPIDLLTKEQNEEMKGIEKAITDDLKAYDDVVKELNSDGQTVKIPDGDETTFKTIPWTNEQIYQKTIQRDELEERIKGNNNRLSGYDRFFGQDYLRDIAGREFKKEDDRLDPTKYKTLDVLQNALDSEVINQDEFDKIARLNKFDISKEEEEANKLSEIFGIEPDKYKASFKEKVEPKKEKFKYKKDMRKELAGKDKSSFAPTESTKQKAPIRRTQAEYKGYYQERERLRKDFKLLSKEAQQKFGSFENYFMEMQKLLKELK